MHPYRVRGFIETFNSVCFRRFKIKVHRRLPLNLDPLLVGRRALHEIYFCDNCFSIHGCLFFFATSETKGYRRWLQLQLHLECRCRFPSQVKAQRPQRGCEALAAPAIIHQRGLTSRSCLRVIDCQVGRQSPAPHMVALRRGWRCT